jgi:predicted ester cyclase
MQQLGAMPLIGPGAVAAGRPAVWGDSSAASTAESATLADNKDILFRFVEAVARGDALDTLADAGSFADHNPSFGTQKLDDVAAMSAQLRAALPDLSVSIERDTAVAEGDRAEAHLLWTGTHTGDELFGVAPSGKQVTWTESDFVRVAGGRIVERWVSADTLSLLQQLGAVPSPGG